MKLTARALSLLPSYVEPVSVEISYGGEDS